MGPAAKMRWWTTITGCSLLTALMIFLACTGSARAGSDIPQWNRTATQVETALRLAAQNPDVISRDDWQALREQLASERDAALALVERGNVDTRIARAQLATIGSPPAEGESEPAPVAERRQQLNARLAAAQAPIVAADDAQARANVLIDEIDALTNAAERKKMLRRAASPLDPRLWVDFIRELGTGFGSLGDYFRDDARAAERWSLLTSRLPLALLLLAGGLFLAFRVQRALIRRIGAMLAEAVSPRRRLALALVRDVVGVFIPFVAVILVAMAVGVMGLAFPSLLEVSLVVFLGGLIVVFAQWLGTSLFLPSFSEARLVALDRPSARRALAFTYMIGLVLAAELLVEYFEAKLAADSAVISILSVGLIASGSYLLWKLAGELQKSARARREDEATSKTSQLDFLTPITRLMQIAALLAPLVALAGYIHLSREILISTLSSIAIASTALFIFRSAGLASTVLFGQAIAGQHRALQFVPILLGFFLTLAVMVLVAMVWGVSSDDIGDAILTLRKGVSFGDVRISFGDALTFGFVFLLGYAITRWVQRIVHVTILPRLEVDIGAETAIVTGIGYLGLVLSAMIAVSAVGLDLSSLAFVAGALSVGIGFGLQSVVANFISGIILLIERPIREGDWIEVAGHSGHVKKISVRSTHIETVDKHEVIVPNSELITGSVTNLTYGGNLGRINLPVGVAYDSDTNRARTILIDVATEHGKVLDTPVPAVLMDGLGDSALNFRLVCFVADVNVGVAVRSELFLEIVRRFREAGIEIPFPRRDLTIRNTEAQTPAGSV